MYDDITTSAHFGIDTERTVGLLVENTLVAVRIAASGELDALASEIRHDELLRSIRGAIGELPDDTATLQLAYYSLDPEHSPCFRSHTFSPAKPLWPDADTGGIVYHGDGTVTQYGRHWRSQRDLERFRATLEETHNHRAFSGRSDAVVLEFAGPSDDDSLFRRPYFPVFYVVVANHGRRQALLREIGSEVTYCEPLLGLPGSRALESLVTYDVPIPPLVGRHTRAAIPALRIAPHDAAAFHVRLVFAQGFATGARLVLDFGEQELLSPPMHLAF